MGVVGHAGCVASRARHAASCYCSGARLHAAPPISACLRRGNSPHNLDFEPTITRVPGRGMAWRGRGCDGKSEGAASLCGRGAHAAVTHMRLSQLLPPTPTFLLTAPLPTCPIWNCGRSTVIARKTFRGSTPCETRPTTRRVSVLCAAERQPFETFELQTVKWVRTVCFADEAGLPKGERRSNFGVVTVCGLGGLRPLLRGAPGG